MTVAQTEPKRLLTERETQVLAAIAEGLSSREAAARLFVSKRTVDFHLRSVFEKLEVSSRIPAIKAAIRLGELPKECLQ